MTLGQIRAALKAGAAPEDIGQPIGEGNFRTAYAVGPFVVKESDNFCERDTYPKIIPGLRFAPTVRVSKGWVTYDIQLRYEPALTNYFAAYGDLHAKNIGMDRRGRYVAFDW